MLRQELGFIEHTLQNLNKPVFVDQGQEQSILLAPTLQTCDVALSDIVAIINKPLETPFERRKFVDKLRF